MLRASVGFWVVIVSWNRSPQVCPFVTAVLGDTVRALTTSADTLLLGWLKWFLMSVLPACVSTSIAKISRLAEMGIYAQAHVEFAVNTAVWIHPKPHVPKHVFDAITASIGPLEK